MEEVVVRPVIARSVPIYRYPLITIHSSKDIPTQQMNSKEIRESARERLNNIDALRRGLKGDSPWLETIVLTKDELATTFLKGESYKRRAKIYIALGLSLGNVLDRRQIQLMDFVYAITLVTQELEAFSSKEVLWKATTTVQARKEKGKKSLFSKAGEEFSLLHVPHFAFPPDYYNTLYSLLDVLYEVHLKITSYLGGPISGGKDLGSSVLDSFNKFSARIKKILAAVHHDIDTLARAKINRELNRVMFGLLPDRGVPDRQLKPSATASFGYANANFPGYFAN